MRKKLFAPKPLSDFLMRVKPFRAYTSSINGIGPSHSSAGKTGTFTAGFGYKSLTPTALTSQKAISITQSDNLQYTRGSLLGGDGAGVNFESLNPNQGTLEFWVRPNWNGNDGQIHTIFYLPASSIGRIILDKTTTDNQLRFFLDDQNDDNNQIVSTSDTITAGNWYHIVVVWSMGAKKIDGTTSAILYVNSVSRGTWTGTLDTFTSLSQTTFWIGQGSAFGSGTTQANLWNGVIAGRILNRPLTSTEVTANYASGAGHTDTFTATPDTVWMGTYSNSDTDAVFWHRGQQVSTTDADTVNVAQAVGSRSWKDNDRVVVWDGTGYKVEGLINEGGGILTTDTSLDLDNLTAANLVNVGRSLDFDALRYAQAADNTIHQITTEDIGISAWVRADSGGIATSYILAKAGNSPSSGYYFYLSSGKISLTIRDATPDTYTISGNTDIRDNKWHQIAGIIDKDNTANCKIYLDGYEDGTTGKSGTLANVGSITSTSIFTLGSYSGLSNNFDGQIRDVILSYPADIMAAGEMGASGEILTLATTPRDLTTVNSEDAWALNDNAATTVVVGSVNNLTASANTSTFTSQEAFISKNLISDRGMDQGGIGAWSPTNATIAKNTSVVKFDTSSLSITNSGAAQGYARQTITTAAGEDYRFHGWFRTPATPNGASQLVDVDGTAALGITVTQAGATTAATWYEVDFTFEAADISTTIDLGSGSATNAEIGYWDNVKIHKNLVDDGGCESALLASWTQEASATMATDISEHSGIQEMKITAGAANVGATQAITLVSGKYYTVSGWARATAGDSAQIIMDKGDATTIIVGTVTATAYTKISASFKSTGTAGNIYLRAVANTDIVWFDDISLIELDQDDPTTTGATTPSTSANSFTTGKWSNLKNALVIDGSDAVYYPVSNNLNSNKGTIVFWSYINSPYTTGDDKVLFDARGADNNNRIKIYYQASSDKFVVYINGADRVLTAAQAANTYLYVWTNFIFTYDFTADIYVLYLNGTSAGSDATAQTAPTLGTNMYLGSNYDGSSQADALFSLFETFKYPFTASQAKKHYYKKVLSIND